MGPVCWEASGPALPGSEMLRGNLKGEEEGREQRREGFGERKHRGRTAGGAGSLARSGHGELRTSENKGFCQLEPWLRTLTEPPALSLGHWGWRKRKYTMTSLCICTSRIQGGGGPRKINVCFQPKASLMTAFPSLRGMTELPGLHGCRSQDHCQMSPSM